MIFDYAILDGQRLPVDQVQISLFDKAVFSSFGVYEAIKVDHGRPFYLEEHLRRLLQSAEMLELELETDVAMLAGWFDRLVELDPQATWRLTIIAYGAIGPEARPLIAMRPEGLASYPDVFYRDGATAVLFDGRRAMPACKSLNTLVNYLARRAATQVGAIEGLLRHDGTITEGSRSNLFAVRQGQLMTPPATAVLSGITREVIMHAMQSSDYPVIEVPLSADLSLYDELFITSTSMHVMPIIEVDRQPIGSGQVGPVTRLASEFFEAHYRQMMAELGNERE